MTPRSLSIAILACAGWAAASDAAALGVGRIPESIAFGQTLDLVLPVHLDPGESRPVTAPRGPAEPRRVQPAALRLPQPDTRPIAAMLAVPAQAASAAEAAAAAAELRLAVMDTRLQTTRAEAAAQRAALEQMRQRLAESEERARMQPLLNAVAAALLLLALWLGWRVRDLQRQRAAAPEAVPRAAVPADRAVAEARPPADASTPALGVDELIDLEQQAEFFLVLGEDGAAVELLMSQLRGRGGASPLPYLELLEIFRRRGDREAYERMRRRFGQRFDAVAPGWEHVPAHGRQLQDYPAASSALQTAWPRPPAAMAELDRLLFPRRNGELLELPACRDVLTLYAVARELHHRPDADNDVDVLLPLAGGDGETPSIFDGLQAAAVRTTAPVDVDLSEPQVRALPR